MSENHAHQKINLIQIRTNKRILNAEIPIDPVRQTDLWLKPQFLELEPKAAPNHQTTRPTVSKFSKRAAFEAIELFAESLRRETGFKNHLVSWD